MSGDGQTNYQNCMAGFDVPLLAIAGKLDYLGTPEGVRLAFDSVSSTDKTYIVFGRANGNIQDYGHGDVVISDAATAEIYPYIFEWVDERN